MSISHQSEILPIRQIVRPVPNGGKIFHFDQHLLGTGGGQVIRPLEGHVATIRPGEGRFGGGAVAVEEGTTNLFSNPMLAGSSSPSNWSVDNYQDNTTMSYNPEAGKIRWDRLPGVSYNSNDVNVGISQTVNVTEGVTYTVSCYAKNNFNWVGYANYAGARIEWLDLSNNTISKDLMPNVGQSTIWRRISWTAAAPAGATKARVRLGTEFNFPEGCYLALKRPQIEAKPFPTSFVDGMRAAGSLTYPISANMIEGTASVWFLYNKAVAQVAQTGSIIRLRDNGGGLRNHIWVRIAPEHDAIRFQVRKDDGSQSNVNIISRSNLPDGWHMLTLRWKASDSLVDLFLDGEYQASLDYHLSDMLPFDTIDVGHRDGIQPLNSLLDGLLILPYAATQEEILSWYHADAPMVDPTSPLGVAL